MPRQFVPICEGVSHPELMRHKGKALFGQSNAQVARRRRSNSVREAERIGSPSRVLHIYIAPREHAHACDNMNLIPQHTSDDFRTGILRLPPSTIPYEQSTK